MYETKNAAETNFIALYYFRSSYQNSNQTNPNPTIKKQVESDYEVMDETSTDLD